MPVGHGESLTRTAITADVPEIIVSTSPAVLIRIDGPPVYRDVPGTDLQRIINTQPFIVRDETGMHYLKISDGWMEAYALDGWWSAAGVTPSEAMRALVQTLGAGPVDLLNDRQDGLDNRSSVRSGTVPAVYVSTTPAELIVINGDAQFAPIEGTSLRYVRNTTSHVFKEPTDQELYVLLSGGWFRAWAMAGPWEHVSGDKLPADFAKIPDGLLHKTEGSR